ncbi:MAG TPA: CCA tRNA nucleotidyltransferase [Terriglobales bacterium]|nr:CCA tRNA nucleotidyltransferase [Terriglobales bacterium]
MSPAEAAARAIAATLRQHGHIAYLAGGCVRDRLLGRPAKDYDIATDAVPERVRSLFPRTVPVGAHFGVILVLDDSTQTEVATFRADAAYEDGRRPISVRFSSPQEDAQRRDFTINGMFLDPASDEVIDYVGGREDLRAGVVRAIGDADARIYEDRLRMLRAVRFAARLGFDIEPKTFAAIGRSAVSISDISAERIGDEIVKMLTDSSGGSARRAFELLDSTDLLAVVLPEIAAMKGVEQSPDYHPEGDVFLHTLKLLEQLEQPSETLGLAALLHDVAKPLCAGRKGERITFYGHCERGAEMAVAVCQRLRRSRETWERVEMLVRDHLRLVDAPLMRTSTLKRFLALPWIDELLQLARLDGLASSGDLTALEFCLAKLEQLPNEEIRPKPLITGRDLIELGLQPGPQFGEILHAVSDAQLEGMLADKQQALAWVAANYGTREAPAAGESQREG